MSSRPRFRTSRPTADGVTEAPSSDPASSGTSATFAMPGFSTTGQSTLGPGATAGAGVEAAGLEMLMDGGPFKDASAGRPEYVSLRRSTRSLAGSSHTTPVKAEPLDNLSGTSSMGPPQSGAGARTGSGGTPSKRVKLEHPSTPSPRPSRAPRASRTPSSARRTGQVKVEPIDGESEVLVELPESTPTPKKKGTPKKAMPLAPLVKAHPEPARWREQYAVIEEMRRGLNAPVDTMGCERPDLGPVPAAASTPSIDPSTSSTPTTAATAGPHAPPLSPSIERALPAQTRRFHVLISLMLSSQTKDAVTSAAVTNLHLTLPGGLTCTSLAAADRGVVEGSIAKVGFWRRKAEYIQEAARRIEAGEIGDDGSFIGEEGEGSMVGAGKGEIPRTIEGLCALKGVGPKMAYLALQCAWDINAGIGVDVHVHRITNRLKWHRPPTVTPEQTRVNLESWLPRELHKGINPMLVGFGQMICQPVGPRCDICLLGTRKLCPTRVSGVKAEGRKPVLFSYKLDGQGDMEDMIKPDLGSGVGAQGIPQEGGVGSVRGIDGADGVGAEGEETEGLVRMKSEDLGVSEPVLAREVGVKVEDS